MITLRADQEDLRGKTRVALRSSSSVLCFAPTGFGKTVFAAALIILLYRAGKRVIFAVHRIDLIKQTAGTFEAFGIPFSYIAAGHSYNPYHRVYIASILTLKNRMKRIEADYIFVDEAHLSAAAGWAAVSKHYKEQGAKQIGLTGSPERLDGKPLADIWDVMVMGPSVRWLIENGHLSRYRAFAPKLVDTSGLHTRKGEFVSAEVDALMEGKAVIGNAARHWRRYADGLRTIAFCPSVKRAQEYADEFSALGIPSIALDAETPQHVRVKAFNDFADGKLMVIFNCALFCEGFDLAAQVGRDITIECCMQLTPTQSLARHLQQMGRALRKKPNPAILLDLVGNIERLGLPDDEREWSLEGKAKREVNTVMCKECFATYKVGEAWACGHEPVKSSDAPVGGGRNIEEVDAELEEIDIEAQRKSKAREQAMAQTLDELIRLATDRGYKSPEKWAAHIYTARQQAGAGQRDAERKARAEAERKAKEEMEARAAKLLEYLEGKTEGLSLSSKEWIAAAGLLRDRGLALFDDAKRVAYPVPSGLVVA